MMSERFTITGHRGAMAVEPENTMRSFRSAQQMGADAVELDVHLSLDGQLVVIHDKTLDRTTDGSGPVAETDLADIQSLDAGAGEHVPTLNEVWHGFPDLGLQIEVKAAAAASAVLDLVRSHPRPGQTLIASFHPEALTQAVAEDGPWLVVLEGLRDAEKLTRRIGMGEDMLLVDLTLSDAPAVQEFRASARRADIGPCYSREEVLWAIDHGWSGALVDDPRMGVAARNESLRAGSVTG